MKPATDHLSIQDSLFLLIPLTVYGYTCAPGIGFGDTAILVDNIQRLLLNSQVNTHPMTVLLGHLFVKLPFDNIAYKANLLSAFCGSLSVFLVYIAVLLAIGNRFIAGVTGICLLLSYSMWWHSTIIENYTVSAVITSCALIAFVQLWRTGRQGWLVILFFWAGLGLFNHVQMGFLSAGTALTFFLTLPSVQRKGRIFLQCAGALLLGLLPWLLLLFIDWRRSGQLGLTLKNAFFGPFGNIFFSSGILGGLRETAVVYLFQFPNFFLPFPLAGIFLAGRRMQWGPAYLGLLAFFTLNTFVFAFYETWDRFAFLLQSFVLLGFFGAFGLQTAWEYLKVRQRPLFRNSLLLLGLSSLLATPGFYEYIWRSGRNPQSRWHHNYHNNYSANLYDQARFIIVPDKHDYRELDIYAGLLFAKLPQNAVYLDDDSRTYYTIADYFQKYYRQRTDLQVLLINSWGIDGWGYSTKALIDFIRTAHRTDKPFFLPSLGRPYSDFLNHLPPDSGIRFERFYLSDSRWIYKMVPLNKKTQQAAGPDSTGIQADQGYVDFHLIQLTHQRNARGVQQYMSGFQGNWQGEDQLFINFTEPDGEISLAVPSDREGWADLKLYYTTAADFGIVALSLNGAEVQPAFDLYAPEVKRTMIALPNKVWLQRGANIFRFSLAGRNPRSSEAKAGFDGFEYRFER